MIPPIGHGRNPHDAVTGPTSATMGGHPSSRQPVSPVPGVLDVIAVVSNPRRFESRYNLYRDFERHMLGSGVRLTTVECAFGERPFEVTSATDPRHVRVRTNEETWIKENLINIGATRLPADARYIAWIDADLQFARPDWVQETLHQLQHHAVVQLFSQATDLSPAFESFDSEHGVVQNGFCASYRRWLESGDPESLWPCYGRKPERHCYEYWHAGFAWAMRRETFDALGGLLDFSGLGSADHMMAWSFLGMMDRTMAPWVSEGFKRSAMIWGDRADRVVRRNIGHVDGLVLHRFHGRKKDRKYQDRWQILVNNGFDPGVDFIRDGQGLIRLTDRSIPLRDGMRAYFRQRNEDSIDL